MQSQHLVDPEHRQGPLVCTQSLEALESDMKLADVRAHQARGWILSHTSIVLNRMEIPESFFWRSSGFCFRSEVYLCEQ